MDAFILGLLCIISVFFLVCACFMMAIDIWRVSRNRCKKCGDRDWQIELFRTRGLCYKCDERRYYAENGWN